MIVTGQAPTPSMLLYAFRLYTKGMGLYVRHALLSLHYSYFMTYFAGGLANPDAPPTVPCVRAALKESEQLMEWEAAFDTLYQSYKLTEVVMYRNTALEALCSQFSTVATICVVARAPLCDRRATTHLFRCTGHIFAS